MRKPTTAAGYPPEMALEAQRMCLYVATILGDLLEDVVVVGGLVPYLIIDQRVVGAGQHHVGTRDLDLGLSIAVLDHARYREIAERLRDRGFEQATNERGQTTRQTWKLRQERITLDFLISPANDGQRAGSLQNLEADFAAIVTPALPLAFRDRIRVAIDDVTPTGERARREVYVSGPASFVVMKAHALRLRGENKDAYDLVYVLSNFGVEPVFDVAARFVAIGTASESVDALKILAEDFASPDHVGPKRRAEFLGDRDDVALRAEAFAAVAEFLRQVTRST